MAARFSLCVSVNTIYTKQMALMTHILRLNTRIMAVVRDAAATMEAEGAPLADESQLVPIAAYVLTTAIGAQAHIERIDRAIFGPEKRRQAAYALHEEWASRAPQERQDRFDAFRADLTRLDPAFSELPGDLGTTKKSFAGAISRLNALGGRSSHPNAKDRVRRELERAADARRNVPCLSAEESHHLFRIADAASAALSHNKIHVRPAHEISLPLNVAVLLRSPSVEDLIRVHEALYPSYSERDDILESYIALSKEYSVRTSDEGRVDVTMQMQALLIQRDETFFAVPFAAIKQALADCPEPNIRGRGLEGPASVLARLIALAPEKTLEFAKMDAEKIRKSLQNAGAEEARPRRS